MGVSGQQHVAAALSRGKIPPYPWNKRLSGSQSRTGCFGVEIKAWPMLGIEPRFIGRSALVLIAVPPTLSGHSIRTLMNDKGQGKEAVEVYDDVGLTIATFSGWSEENHESLSRHGRSVGRQEYRQKW